ncbi:MAG TPA: ROK family protein [Ilumatobacteraceae bacterium]|nr:ROK family protein [Ilumatobacteraceae bacterium]
MGLTIGVDVGGTKIAVGVVDESGHLKETTRRDTPYDDPMKTEDAIADGVRELQARQVVEAIGVGAAGFVDADRSTVLFAPNLAWRNEPLRRALEARLGLPVVIENDANAASWAEARFGAGKGESHVVVVTVGTGIGGGIVLDGQLVRGRFGVAAEIGHLTIVPDGRRCGSGNQGRQEQSASGRALVAEARALATASPAIVPFCLRSRAAAPARSTAR